MAVSFLLHSLVSKPATSAGKFLEMQNFRFMLVLLDKIWNLTRFPGWFSFTFEKHSIMWFSKTPASGTAHGEQNHQKMKRSFIRRNMVAASKSTVRLGTIFLWESYRPQARSQGCQQPHHQIPRQGARERGRGNEALPSGMILRGELLSADRWGSLCVFQVWPWVLFLQRNRREEEKGKTGNVTSPNL